METIDAYGKALVGYLVAPEALVKNLNTWLQTLGTWLEFHEA